jgi:hypothetical protein
MQVPISQMVRKWMHAVTRKFVTEILVSSLATLLVMTFFPNLTKAAYLFTRDDTLLTSTGKSLAAGESSDTLDDFMEHVALSHISGLKTPPVAASQESIVAVNEPTTDTGAPLPPLAAAPRHERASSSKVHVASVAKVLPPLPPIAVIEPAAGPAPAVIEPAVVPASSKAEVPLVAPLQYGMHLISNLGTIISVSQTRVVESVASVGDALTSLAKTSLNKKL